MHKIKSISIQGFLGQEKSIEFKLSNSANFIIGKNGTGKTTLINLINACLSLDSEVLSETEFFKVQFSLKEKGKRSTPQVSIFKSFDEHGHIDISYEFRSSASGHPERLSLTTKPKRRSMHSSNKRIFAGVSERHEIKNKISKLLNVTWLSLHRGTGQLEHDDWDIGELEYTSGVDQKLEEVSNELTRYFSLLDRKVADLTQHFQREWFLSFLATEKSTASALRADVNVADEKKAIRQIFEKFAVPETIFSQKLEKHGRLAEKALNNLDKDGRIKFEDFLVVYDVMRLHTLVEQWQDLQERQSRIYEPREKLIGIATELLFRKSLHVDKSNAVCFTGRSGSPIPLGKLSSGEKQLVIFLAETLLQDKETYVFLADEPELSLHIDWQEKLVPSILKINPSAQILFATHSPDVVGEYQNDIFNMEHVAE